MLAFVIILNRSKSLKQLHHFANFVWPPCDLQTFTGSPKSWKGRRKKSKKRKEEKYNVWLWDFLVGRVYLEESVLSWRRHTDLRKKSDRRKVKKLRGKKKSRKVKNSRSIWLFTFSLFETLSDDVGCLSSSTCADMRRSFCQLREPGRGGNHGHAHFGVGRSGVGWGFDYILVRPRPASKTRPKMASQARPDPIFLSRVIWWW